MTPVDRRRHPRYTLQVPAVLVSAHGEQLDGNTRIMDLSEGGAFLVAPARVSQGTGVRLRFRHGAAGACGAAGRVLRALPFGARTSGFAVAFDRVDDALRAFLRTLGRTPEALRPALLDALSDVCIQLEPGQPAPDDPANRDMGPHA